MDQLKGSHHQTKMKRQTKSKNRKPIKVVYISNPMMVKTSASKFRALVQELTGLHSDPADIAKFTDTDNGSDESPRALHQPTDAVDEDHGLVSPVPIVDPDSESSRSAGASSPFEYLDDVFTSQTLENIWGFFPSGSFYEPQVDLIRSLDVV